MSSAVQGFFPKYPVVFLSIYEKVSFFFITATLCSNVALDLKKHNNLALLIMQERSSLKGVCIYMYVFIAFTYIKSSGFL